MPFNVCIDCNSDNEDDKPALSKSTENKTENKVPIWKLKCGISWMLWRFICMGSAYAMHTNGEKWTALILIIALSAPACLWSVPRVAFEGLVLGSLASIAFNPDDNVS
jgi:hypothetical protein